MSITFRQLEVFVAAAEDCNFRRTADYFGIRQWGARLGTVLAPADDESASKIAVLGQTVVDHLFGADVDPLGRAVRIRGIPFTVVGVLDRKGQSATGQDFDDGIYVPVKTFQANIQGGLAALKKLVEGG